MNSFYAFCGRDEKFLQMNIVIIKEETNRETGE